MLSLRVDRIKPQPVFCSAFDMGSNKEAEGQQKNDGQTPESTNRNHIGCSCGILPVAALLEFIEFHLIKNQMSAFMSEGKATLPTELLYLPLTVEALAVQHLIAFIFTRWRLTATSSR